MNTIVKELCRQWIFIRIFRKLSLWPTNVFKWLNCKELINFLRAPLLAGVATVARPPPSKQSLPMNAALCRVAVTIIQHGRGQFLGDSGARRAEKMKTCNYTKTTMLVPLYHNWIEKQFPKTKEPNSRNPWFYASFWPALFKSILRKARSSTKTQEKVWRASCNRHAAITVISSQ